MKQRWTRFIAGVEIFGGVSGIIVTVVIVVNSGMNFFTALLGGIGVSLSALCVGAGVLLWRNHPAGMTLSLIIQALQIPRVSFGGLLYYFFLGIDTGLAVSGLEPGADLRVHFSLNFGGNLRLNIGTDPNPIMLGVNIFAIFAFSYLLKQLMRPQVGTEEKLEAQSPQRETGPDEEKAS